MLLDLCLALGVPSIRHLEQALTPGEVNLWLRKYANDQFGQHGQDVRDAIRQARLFSALHGLGGKRKAFHPRKFLVSFEPAREESTESMRRKAEALARAMGGDVIRDGKKVN